MDRRRVYGPPLHGSRRALLVVAVAIPAVAGAWLQGSLPPFNHRDPAFRPAVDAIDRLTLLARDVPTSSLLVADEGLVAPLAGRPRVIRLGAVPDLSVTSFVILDRSAWSPTGGVARLHDQVLARLSNSARPVLRDDGRFILFGPDPTGPSP